MSDEVRVNRQPMQSPAGSPMHQEPMQSQSKMPWVILGVVVVVLIVIGALFRDKLFNSGSKDDAKMTQSAVKSSGYQAVFLTNGQVYFGKVSDMEKDFMTVKDIYYLQVIQQPPLQGSTQQPGQAPQQQISLVKLGNELHGPVDEMHISRSQVLFYEDLKEDGSVVKAIRDYKATPAASPTPAK